MDAAVQDAQKWLNATYGGVSGWVPLDEDGITGWSVMFGLRRALQTELGISPVSSGFGPATTAAYVSKIGRIGAMPRQICSRSSVPVCGARAIPVCGPAPLWPFPP